MSSLDAQFTLPLTSGLVLASPIPEAHSIPFAQMSSVIAEAIRLAQRAGATGKDNTPFVLSKIRELTKGESVRANRALIEANVARGAKVAVALAKLETEALKEINEEAQ